MNFSSDNLYYYFINIIDFTINYINYINKIQFFI